MRPSKGAVTWHGFRSSNGAMAAIRQTQELVQKAPTVLAPLTLGFADCFALVLAFLLMMISAVVPGRQMSE